ncbi:MAG: hypothetical protein E6H78_09405, partial [Betaproteobacteria bacterium]
WPSRSDLTTEEQQQELVAILDRAASLRMNAIIFQVRPEADALYASPYEPWSRYLTGKQGQAPNPVWDPLRFAVTEAHRRGLELHAWFNPYRAAFHRDSTTARTHITHRRPDLVVPYSQYFWMNPGIPEVRRRTIRAVLDVVRRYDVDGVHIDDYFYPYPETDASHQKIEFPDAKTHAAYRRAGGTLDRDDWRRRNVNTLVRELYAAIKDEKPWVKFGISPFGIWRPGVPPTTTAGLDQYAELYADARKWLRDGTLDYMAPQLYWPILPPEQSYPVLLEWWVGENVKRLHRSAAHDTGRHRAGDPDHARDRRRVRSHSVQRQGSAAGSRQRGRAPGGGVRGAGPRSAIAVARSRSAVQAAGASAGRQHDRPGDDPVRAP